MTRRSTTGLALLILALYSFFLSPSSFDVPFAHAAQGPTFRTGTTLVEFTIVALDVKGNPVTDLTKEELVLTDGGKPRDIAFFRFDGSSADAMEVVAAPLPEGFVSNRPEYLRAPQRNVTAIVMDFLNTAPNDQVTVRSQTLEYLRHLPPNTRAGVFRFSETHAMDAVQEITDNPELIRRQLETLQPALRRELVTPLSAGAKIIGGDCHITDTPPPTITLVPRHVTSRSDAGAAPGKAESAQAMTDAQARGLADANRQLREIRLMKTLANLEALGHHLSGIPGRKSVVWITSGMPVLLNGAGTQGNAAGISKNYEPQIRRTAQRLANQGIAVYPVDAKGLCRQGDWRTAEQADGSHDAPPMVFASLDVVADTTGGRVIKHTNDPTIGVTTAANDQRGTYTIGFYAADEPRTTESEWQNLEVSVRRRGVLLRYRQGYLAVRRTQPASWAAAQWQELAFEPLGSTAIRMNARTGYAGEKTSVSLQIEGGDLYFHEKDGQVVADLEVGVVEKTGNVASNVRAQRIEISLKNPTTDGRAQLIPLQTTWTVNPATTSLRVIVRDRFTGRYGTVDTPLTRATAQ